MKSAESWAEEIFDEMHTKEHFAILVGQLREVQDNALECAAEEIRRQKREWRTGPMDGHFDFEPHPEELAVAVLELKKRLPIPPPAPEEPAAPRAPLTMADYTSSLTVSAEELAQAEGLFPPPGSARGR